MISSSATPSSHRADTPVSKVVPWMRGLCARSLPLLLLPSVAWAAEAEGKGYLTQIAPIVILLAVITFAISRLPKVESLGHSDEFLRRRIMNWLPLGLTYAFLYMGRYNIKVSQHAFGDMMHGGEPLMTNGDFATIFFWGTLTYGCSFIINGPLTDRMGGKFSILVGAAGSSFMNLMMGLVTWQIIAGGELGILFADNLTGLFSFLVQDHSGLL